ncbi:MAG: Zn-dependent alcohol dehydrogenase [Porticoccaceae bacterium]|nr:Zn-dependent alcohol dehydrogenase [Porticoccaceae bacterium]
MRQAVMTAPGVVKIVEAAVPEPGSKQIQINIKRIGICGSDVHVWHGAHPFTSYPVIQGHEYCGIVSKIGSDVTDISVGQLVTALPQEVCGKCVPCRRGNWHVCDNLKVRGFQAPGCAQDYFVTETDKVIVLPESFTLEQGAFIEPLAVASHSTSRAGLLKGTNVAVLGAGTIGNFVGQMAQAKGAKVLIGDVSETRLEVAQACGLPHIFNPEAHHLSSAVDNVFGSEGIDIVFDCAGVQLSLDAAISSVNKGGTVLVVAVFGQRPKVDMAVVCESELNLIGTMMYHHNDYRQAVQSLLAGDIKTSPLESEHFTLEEFQVAYEFIDQRASESMKVFIDLDRQK